MKKFKYRIESYLKFVKYNRESALKELKKAERYRDSLVEKYEFMESQMREAYQMNSEIGQSGRNIHFINDNNQFLVKLKVHMENLSHEIAQAEQDYKAKYQALVELQLKVKKMELHKEAELEKFKAEYRKKSQKLTDEINSTRKRGA